MDLEDTYTDWLAHYYRHAFGTVIRYPYDLYCLLSILTYLVKRKPTSGFSTPSQVILRRACRSCPHEQGEPEWAKVSSW
jgi:hypothetical protein